MKRFAWLLAVALVLGSAFAQVGTKDASHEDTPAWIATKITDEAGLTRSLPSSGYSKESYRNVSMSDCRLGYTVILYNSFTKLTVTDRISITLDKDTSVSVIHDFVKDTIDDYAVAISTVSRTIAIDRTRETDGHPEAKEILSTDRTVIIFGKPNAEMRDTVSRVQKGLTHAIQLCSTATPKRAS